MTTFANISAQHFKQENFPELIKIVDLICQIKRNLRINFTKNIKSKPIALPEYSLI